MNHRPEDHLDKDLEALEKAYSAMASDEPPELIDQAVLNRARRELDGDSGRRPWSFGWIHGLTSTAIVVLAVTIYTHYPNPGDSEPMRVAKPPSSKLRDIEAEIQPLQIPARPAATESDSPAIVREIRRQAPAGMSSNATELSDATAVAEMAEETPKARAEASEVSEARFDQGSGVDEDTPGPERWLERILELKREGEDEQVAQELRAFRQSWPDYPIPSELLD